MTEEKTETVTIEFTSDEFELLQEIVSEYQDRGPRDEGWKSPEASQLDAKIQAIWDERHKDVLSKYAHIPHDGPVEVTAGSMLSVLFD